MRAPRRHQDLSAGVAVWRRWRWRWRDLARAEIRRIAEDLRGVELAAVGRHPRYLRTVRALHRTEAAMADIRPLEAGNAAVLCGRARRMRLIEGDLGRGNAPQVLDQRIPALDQRPEVGPREQECAGAAGDLDDAGVVDDLGAARALDDGDGAAADADIGRRRRDRRLALVAPFAADEAQRPLGQRHQHVAALGVRIVNIL